MERLGVYPDNRNGDTGPQSPPEQIEAPAGVKNNLLARVAGGSGGQDLWWNVFIGLNVAVSLLASVGAAWGAGWGEWRPLIYLGRAGALLAVPVTHGVGGRWRYGSGWHFYQPFRGGLPFIVCQAVAWILFGISLLPWTVVPMVTPALPPHSEGKEAKQGWGGALFLALEVCTFLSEALVALSLWLFSSKGADSSEPSEPVSPSPSLSGMDPGALRRANMSRRELRAEYASDQPLDEKTVNDKRSSDIRSCSLGPSFRRAKSFKVPAAPKSKEPQVVPPRVLSASVEPYYWSAGEIELALSGPWAKAKTANNSTEAYHTQADARRIAMGRALWWLGRRLRSLFTLSMIYLNYILTYVLLLLPYLLLPLSQAVLFYCVLAGGYAITYGGAPQKTGRRAWPWLQKKFSHLLEEMSVLHYGGITIARDSEEPLAPLGRYVFAYHPHGLFPATIAWLHLTRAWRRLFPGIRPTPLVASIIFKVPFMRELNMWAGCREVSRLVFSQTLQEKRAVFMCPGGQSELAMHVSSDKTHLYLCTRHKGFVRLALENNAALVPVISFGESLLFDNLFDWPAAQRYTYKRLGFPIPFMPVGWLGWTLLPRTTPQVIMVGEPFNLPQCEGSPSEELINETRDNYYQRVFDLFEKHKGSYGFEQVQLVMQE